MARKVIDVGVVGNDGTGDSIRDSFRKVNDNFRELYSSLGLGERLTFIGLDDTPSSFAGQNDPTTGSTPLLTINNTESGIAFKALVPGTGMQIDYISNPDQITLNAEFSSVQGDPSPRLGGNLNVAKAGGGTPGEESWRITNLITPKTSDEAVNKAYADSKLSRAGVDTFDPALDRVNSALGYMSGPLILSRSPEPEDDQLYAGLIAATKSYVDSSAFGSVANLFVATSGQDERPGISKQYQGRALAYAYRSLEAALKRAEELILDSRLEIGPYKKTLTFNNGAGVCTLALAPYSSPVSGSGFAGTIRMSVDTVTLTSPDDKNYYAGDILTINGGTLAPGGGAAKVEVLTTATTPGKILTYRIISTGAYSTLPGSTDIGATITTSAAPPSVGAIGELAKFSITYKVNSVAITSGGTGYSLVSVRITGGGGAGAFGTGVVTGGVVSSITVDDQGSGFTSIPTLSVDLPRFAIRTDNYRTDFTGDVLTDTPEAYRGRDIREGLYLSGVTSGALAQILGHSGELDSFGNELFDVDIKYGAFEVGEPIAYGDITKNTQITILVESGIYEENLPLKIPQNVSVVGDEFRRCIIRPKQGISSSPWAFQKFRRDLTIDGITTATQLFGYHYLTDTSLPVYDKVSNPGAFTSAAALLTLNRPFMQEEITSWIAYQVTNNIAPFTSSFDYNSALCKRDVGLIIDSLIFDLKWGNYNRTMSAALKYYQQASDLGDPAVAIGVQLDETVAAIERLNVIMISVIANTAITGSRQSIYPQVIDLAYSAEVGSSTVINELIDAFIGVIDGTGTVNFPKNNDAMDMFLANDAVRWQAITGQGHGGFMGVLDPQGQILAKSPYFQECASFSKSNDRHRFAGGIFVDGFAGNLQFQMTTIVSPIRIQVTGLDRYPNLPCSFIVFDSVYRINYVRDFVYDKDGSSATFILDETTPWPFDIFTYNSVACYRDTGLIIDGLGYGIVFGTNYHSRKAGLTYRLANAAVVINDQREITLSAIELAHTIAKTLLPDYTATIDSSYQDIAGIIERGPVAAPILSFTLPPGLSTNLTNAYTLLMANREYIKAEVIAWTDAQIAGNIAPFDSSFTYNASRWTRDIGYNLEALIYDLIYGGNSETRESGLKYFNNLTGLSMLEPGEPAKMAAAIDYANTITQRIIQNLAPVATYSALSRTTGTGASATEATRVNTLMSAISATITGGTLGSAPALVAPDLTAYAYTTANKNARTSLQSSKSSIQTQVIDYVDTNGNLYEILMPGNRSMLSNDYTQVNDMGYGAVAHNGGLIELVSMFTYYCYCSYYSLNGGQIRSVGGSSAHGIYALVAEGSDPLEVPTPTTAYEEFSQSLKCYYPSPSYANTVGGLFIYVYAYDYTPLGGSELEIEHANAGNPLLYRYSVTSVTVTDLPPGVARLNIGSGVGSGSEGLFDQVSSDTKMTIRMGTQVLLTGGLVDVAVRPSTGLKLRETEDAVYRVLQFSSYTDSNGPYEISVSGSIFKVTIKITTIASTSLCTTSQNHKLKTGDKFIASSTANGFVSGTTYYVTDVPEYNQFTVSTSPGGASPTLTNGTGLSIKGAKTHKLLENYTVSFESTGTLPSPLVSGTIYYVLSSDLTDTEFAISTIKNGTAISVAGGSGVHSLSLEGVTLTNIRENYNYIDLTLWQPGEFTSDYPTGRAATISIASPAVISLASHGFTAGTVIKFTNSLGGVLPTGLSTNNNYFVLSAGLGAGSFRVSLEPGGTAVDTTGSQSGTHYVGKVTGRAGDTAFAVVPVGSVDIPRVDGSKFVFLGEEYTILDYQPETVTNEAFARVNLDRALANAINGYSSSYTVKSAVPIRTGGSLGNLTIRISLTRVTSHDLLEIGTGSYADTNYPSEIYGPSVNPINPDAETDERDVGRVFYVTTDQFGNFSVGPYFRVDQGTGTVTFSSSIALSNLDGIGFKRGVPVSEFSTDSGFTDNATDTVPTENAARIYIERRLGLTHDGSPVTPGLLIPTVTGGYMSLDGQLSMKGNMNLDQHKITNVTNPTDAQDAVNLRSLTWNNFQDFTGTNVDAADLVVFTGVGKGSINATVVGDVTLELRPSIDSTLNQLDVQINPDTIINADVKSDAAIDQTKLALDNTYVTSAASITGVSAVGSGSTATITFATTISPAPFSLGQRITISGLTIAGYNGTYTVASCNTTTLTYTNTTTGSATGGTIRPFKGIASFNSTQFDADTGWVSLKENGTPLAKLEQVAAQTLLGNSTLGVGNVTAVPFSTVVASGAAVKKSQYSTTGFLRRTSAVSFASDSDYTIIEGAAGSSASVEAGKLIIRDSNGDFGGRIVDISQLKMDTKISIDTATTATGGYIRYYGYDTAGGILVQNGSLAADKKTAYWNDSHNFKTQDGISDAPITASSIQVQTITTGDNRTNGQITGRWTLTGTSPNESRLQATYSADLAEYYEGDKEYEVGTVLVFGGDKEVTITGVEGDTRVAGVVSNTAAFVMYDACPGHKNLVALQGRVPCKVVGRIKKGDMLVTSKIQGVAVAAGKDVKVGTVVGKALVDYDSDHIGTIEIAVGRT